MGKSMQYLAMFSGSTFVLVTGINLGWASPYLPILESDLSPVGHISSDAAFWCSVMPLVGAIPGALLAGAIVDKFGRKTMLIAISPICFACFLAMAFTDRLWVIDVARFIIGSLEGATYTVLPIYFAEIAEPNFRGTMSSSIIVGAVLGLLLINTLATFASIFVSSLIVSAIPVLHFVTFIWMPKSPYYLIKIGRIEEARANLIRLRSRENVSEEFADIMAAVKRQEAEAKSSSWKSLFTQKSNRRAIYIYLILAISNKMSGANPIMFYTHTIFAQADSIVSPATSVILFHCVGCTTIVFAASVMDRFGRRPLMLTSIIGCGCSLALMAAYFTMQTRLVEMHESMKLIPLIALISYYAIFNLGICLGPVVFLSELFPTSVKGFALGAADSTSVTLGTIAAKIFHTLSLSYGMHVPFWLFAFACLCGALMIYLFVPETKGRTLEEIQLELTTQSIRQTVSKQRTKKNINISAGINTNCATVATIDITANANDK